VPDLHSDNVTAGLSGQYSLAPLVLRNRVTADEALTRWAGSGAMWLTGSPEGPPSPRPAALAAAADAAMAALRNVAGVSWRGGNVDAAALLGEHAAAAGWRRGGRVSAGGSARIAATADGHLALNLARRDDVDLLSAWLEISVTDRFWCDVERTLLSRRTQDLVARGRLLGLPLAPAAPAPLVAEHQNGTSWVRLAATGPRGTVTQATNAGERRSPRVVDFSALWAGPLASHLLGLAGADVIRVEDQRRPDGARAGAADFYDLLNAGKQSVALDFSCSEDRRRLHALVDSADIVIEASRPRALRQLGLDAETLVKTRPGLTWISITGYGRTEPEADWVAFGDDAAAAAGLASLAGDAEQPIFCADAVADPLTGIHAALAAQTFHAQGGGALVDVSLCRVAGCDLKASPLGADTNAVLGTLT